MAFDIHLLFEIIFEVILVKNSHKTNALTNIIAFDLTKWFSTIHLYRNYFISVAFYSISIHNNQRPYYKFKTFQQITFRFFFARELCSWQYVLHKSRYLQVQNHLNLCSNLCKKFGTNFCIEKKRNSPANCKQKIQTFLFWSNIRVTILIMSSCLPLLEIYVTTRRKSDEMGVSR